MSLAAVRYCSIKSIQVGSLVWIAALIISATHLAIIRARGVAWPDALDEFMSLFFFVWALVWVLSTIWLVLMLRKRATSGGTTLEELGSVSKEERKNLERKCRI